MSLQRQLLIVFFSIFSAFFLFQAGFLTLQHFIIIPSTDPFYISAKTNDILLKDENSQDSSVPSQLIIPDHQIDLPITPSLIADGEWQVSTQGVSLLTGTFIAQKQGIILFGHDWSVLLGRLQQAKIGETIFIQFPDGKRKTFTVTSVFTTDPKHIDILKMAKQDTILIYTCSGFMDTKRFIVLGKLVI